jgi:hypothetical protein
VGSDRVKDVVVAPAWKLVEVDVPAIPPAPHCSIVTSTVTWTWALWR